jgi:putative heme-binding domain-containing protein
VAELASAETSGRATYFRRVAAMIGARRQTDEIRRVVSTVLDDGHTPGSWWRAASLNGLADGLRGREAQALPLSAERALLLERFFAQDDAVRDASLNLLRVVGAPAGHALDAAVRQAVGLAPKQDADPQLRADAFRLLALTDPAPHAATVRGAIDPREPATVQRAAVAALARIGGEETGRFLLGRWSVMTPEVRDAVVDALMTERARVRLLLDAIERNQVQTSTVGWARSVAQYRAALALPGDATRGRGVFQASCSQCHQTGGRDGIAFGPDLGTVRHWSSQALLAKILNPSRSIADGYELWLVQRRSGGTVAGVIAAETPTTVTLRNAGQPDVTIPRSDIESISSANVSVMPSGLERQIDEQQMADLIAYIRNQQ